MKEEELLGAQQIGDVIKILQKTTHHLYDPDELLTVSKHLFMVTYKSNQIGKVHRNEMPSESYFFSFKACFS